MRRVSVVEARRIAVSAQLLDARRPGDLLTVADRLTFLQLDPTAVVAPNADLVMWSRAGDRYQAEHLQKALATDRTMFEFRGQDHPKVPVLVVARPMADLGLFLAEMTGLRDRPGQVHDWLAANVGFQTRVLDQLRDHGPLSSRAIPDTAEVPWASSGWTNDRNVTQLLEFLGSRGVVVVAGRDGKQRLWDLADRVYPPDTKVVPLDQAHRVRDERRLRSLGIARPNGVGDAGVSVEVEGTSRLWRLDPEATAEGFEGRCALLSPFDRLIHDRRRTMELFVFDYLIELYKPLVKRRWGYFAMPVLFHDRLVGKVDAAADRQSGRLIVNAVHRDVEFTRAMTSALDDELAALARWFGLDGVHHT